MDSCFVLNNVFSFVYCFFIELAKSSFDFEVKMRHFSLFLILEEINASLYARVFENYQYRVSGLGLTD